MEMILPFETQMFPKLKLILLCEKRQGARCCLFLILWITLPQKVVTANDTFGIKYDVLALI
jgi:hypothetical protein